MSEKQPPSGEIDNKTEQRKEKISGYFPMQIERGKDGKLYLPDGTEVLPNIAVGPEDHHLRLFVEYERTFGRGKAKYLTHSGMEEKDFVREYHELAERHGQIAVRGSPEEIEKFIHDLENYRKKHPELYEDVKQKGKPSRIRILSSKLFKDS